MTVISAYPPVRASAAKRSGRTVHTVEKIKPRADYNGEYGAQRQPRRLICIPSEAQQAYQSGTNETASFWDAPRLKPEFAAQVLGQALNVQAPKAFASAAYSKAASFAPLLDKAV
jgi:hypothetical protein